MSYQVPPPREPSGCLQTLVITRIMFQILAVPMLLILGGIICVGLTLYAFTAHFLLGLLVIAITIALLTGLAKWEYDRVKRDLPPPDEIDRIDPRMR